MIQKGIERKKKMVKTRLKLKKNVAKKFIGYGFLLLVITTVIMAMTSIKQLNVLPNKYFYLAIGIEVFLTIIVGLILLKTKRMG